MASSGDLSMLTEMGFDMKKATLALKKGGNLQSAIDWLEKNQDKSIEDLEEDEAEDDGMPKIQPGEEARSLLCKDCGKKFRSQAQAEFHASKTEHMNFEESTEEIAPLTEEEKKTKLAELKARAAERKAAQSAQDKIEQKRNEEINRKKQRDQQDIKEELAKKEQIKEAANRKKDKQDDIDAKARIKAKIAADKEERRLKAEREKAARTGQAMPTTDTAPVAAAAPSAPKTTASYTEARLRLQTPNGTVQKTFPIETTLFEVGQALSSESGMQVTSFTQNFPKKVFDGQDLGQTLKEAGLVPSAALIVK